MQKRVFITVFGLLAIASMAHGAGPSDARTVLHVGPGFIVGGGSAQPGVGLGIARKVTRIPIHVGFDSGVFFATSPNIVISLPVLAQVYYRFPTNAEIVPTLGLGIGAILGFGTGAQFAQFMMMVNPGFQFYLDQDMDLFFRSSLGFIGSTFEFYPQIGATFKI